jgi:hypothetical protein
MHAGRSHSFRWSLGAVLLVVALVSGGIHGQDRILLYGNSIISGAVAPYFGDLVEQSGQPRPLMTSLIQGNATTTTYVANIGLITSSLPAGTFWKAMVVQGGTIETTPLGNPAAFEPNMLTLAAALYEHSPQAQFVGHETGADHPNSSNYPSLFPNPATWLAYPQAAYASARAAIDAAHPTALPARLALQGTAVAETTGYDVTLFAADLHHLSNRGKLLCALLYYTQIYDARACELVVDFSVQTPLVTRLQSNGITKEQYDAIAGYADRVMHRSKRPYPGSDSDFQLRSGINVSLNNLCPMKTATAGAVLTLEVLSPLGAGDAFSIAVHGQLLPTGTAPAPQTLRGLHLSLSESFELFSAPDLSSATTSRVIPAGLSGYTLWMQAASSMPPGTPGFPLALSDAQTLDIQ